MEEQQVAVKFTTDLKIEDYNALREASLDPAVAKQIGVYAIAKPGRTYKIARSVGPYPIEQDNDYRSLRDIPDGVAPLEYVPGIPPFTDNAIAVPDGRIGCLIIHENTFSLAALKKRMATKQVSAPIAGEQQAVEVLVQEAEAIIQFAPAEA